MMGKFDGGLGAKADILFPLPFHSLAGLVSLHRCKTAHFSLKAVAR
jgi:hypothetical protein